MNTSVAWQLALALAAVLVIYVLASTTRRTVALGVLLVAIPFQNSVVANFTLGGTALLIVVSVVVETMKQLEAQLMMRNYEGFIR